MRERRRVCTLLEGHMSRVSTYGDPLMQNAWIASGGEIED